MSEGKRLYVCNTAIDYNGRSYKCKDAIEMEPEIASRLVERGDLSLPQVDQSGEVPPVATGADEISSLKATIDAQDAAMKTAGKTIAALNKQVSDLVLAKDEVEAALSRARVQIRDLEKAVDSKAAPVAPAAPVTESATPRKGKSK